MKHFTWVFLCIFLSLLVVIPTFSDAKYIEGQFQIRSEDPEAYFGKFAFSPDTKGTISGQIQITKVAHGQKQQYPVKLVAALFDDKGWEIYLREKYAKCSDRLRYAKELFDIPVVRNNVNTPSVFNHKITSKSNRRAHHTYMIVSACEIEYYPSYPPPIDFEVTFLNGDSHLPADELGTTVFFYIVFGILCISIVFYIINLSKINKKYNQVHFISLVLGLALFLQTMACLAQIFHFIKYQSDGKGFKLRHTWLALDFFAEMNQLGTELITAFVLISIALGWLFSDSFHMSRILFSPKPQLFFASITFLHVFLQYKGRRYFEDFNQFHDYSHWPGFVLVVLRLLFGAIFFVGTGLSQGIVPDVVRRSPLYGFIFGTIFGIVSRTPVPANDVSLQALNPSTAQAQPVKRVFQGNTDGYVRDAEPEVVKLLNIITLVGTIWFLAFPVLVITAPLFAAVDQKAYVGWGSLLTHVIVLLFMLFAFLLPSSAFFKNSSLKNIGTVFASNGSLGNPNAPAGRLGIIRKAAFD